MTFREQEVKIKSQIQFSHLSVPLIYHCLLSFTNFRVRNQWFLGLLESGTAFEAHCQMLFATFWQLSRERSASTVPAWTTQGYDFRARPQRRPVSSILATNADLFLRTTKRWLVQLRKNLEEPGPRTSTLGWPLLTPRKTEYAQRFKNSLQLSVTTSSSNMFLKSNQQPSPCWFFHSKYKKKLKSPEFFLPSKSLLQNIIFSPVWKYINWLKLLLSRSVNL